MASRFIMFPFLILLLVAVYQLYQLDFVMSDSGLWEGVALLSGGISIVLYFIGGEIDWWWWTKNPPKLSNGFKLLLINHVPYYQNLNVAQRQKFQNRVALFFRAHEFMPMGELANQGEELTGGYFDGGSSKSSDNEDEKPVGRIPADMMLFIASSLVQLTFGKKKWWLKKTDQVVIYPRPFPTPQMPEHFHTNETFLEDKVIMFSAEQLLQYYNLGSRAYAIGIHEYTNAFQQNYPAIKFPDLPNDFWERAEAMSGFGKSYLHEYMNLPAMDAVYSEVGELESEQKNEYRKVQRLSPHHVSVTLFFTHAKLFKAQFPKLHDAYSQIFNQDPALSGNTVLGEEI